MQIENHSIKRISFDAEADALVIESYAKHGSRFRLDSWKKGLALYREERLLTCHTHVNLLLFTSQETPENSKWTACIARFTSDIPREIKDIAAPISFAQLQVLQILRRGNTAAAELAHKAPALLWLLACDVLSNRISVNRAANLLKNKRLKIIQAIHADSTKKHLNLVTKTKPLHYCRQELRTLNRILKDDNLQNNLRHLPQIQLPLVEIVLDTPDILAIPCIQHEINNPGSSRYQIMVARTICESCLQIGRKAGLANVKHNLSNCKTLAEVTALEKSWHDRYNKNLQKQRALFGREQEAAEVLKLAIEAEKERQRQERRERKRLEQERRKKIRNAGFPSPPIPGNKYIVPITSFTELEHEGEVMNNCVATYKDKILFESSYIYKVFYPQRCTLEVIAKRHCRIGELKARNNAKPAKKVYQFVRRWLNDFCSKGASKQLKV